MKKDYGQWHERKTHINDARGTALFHEREIWWCVLGANVGYEQDGSSQLFTRPVVILTKFNLDVCLVVPLTTRPKVGKYYFPLGKIADRDAIAILSQIRLIDRKRLAVKMATVPEALFDELMQKTVNACFPNLKP